MTVIGGMGVEGTVGGLKGQHQVYGPDGLRPRRQVGKAEARRRFSYMDMSLKKCRQCDDVCCR